MLGGGGLDDGELGAVDSEAVLDVFDAEVEVDGAAPVDVSVSLVREWIAMRLARSTLGILVSSTLEMLRASPQPRTPL
jgi:hypothetical protein